MLNFLAAKVYSECEFSPKNYRRTHENEEFTLYAAKETANPGDLNFSEHKCHISYEHEYFDNPGTVDRWFECSNGITIVEDIHSPARNIATHWHLRDASRENKDKAQVLPLIEKSSTEEKYYQTNPVDFSFITQELTSDFVYRRTTNHYLNKLIFRLIKTLSVSVFS